jgi:hypothetical protein
MYYFQIFVATFAWVQYTFFYMNFRDAAFNLLSGIAGILITILIHIIYQRELIDAPSPSSFIRRIQQISPYDCNRSRDYLNELIKEKDASTLHKHYLEYLNKCFKNKRRRMIEMQEFKRFFDRFPLNEEDAASFSASFNTLLNATMEIDDPPINYIPFQQKEKKSIKKKKKKFVSFQIDSDSQDENIDFEATVNHYS